MPELTKVQTGFLEGQGQFELDPGTEAAPGVTFGDSSTGLYKSATDEVAVSISGTQKVKFTSTGVTGNLTGNVTGDLTGNVTGESIIQNISSEIADTAVDIFIYDTSKDSDGGAWRQRTSHTSWYNETLNTATRGSRREFPAVAVIVAESQKLTIYDGDDPDLPMWMVFNRGLDANPTMWWDGNNANAATAITALNGLLMLSTTSAGSYGADFIGERWIYFYNGQTNSGFRHNGGGLKYRNSAVSSRTVIEQFSGYALSSNHRDVAMTVLPNAHIDNVTQLPRPTILIGQNGGLSIIKDDYTVLGRVATWVNGGGVWEVQFDEKHGGYWYSTAYYAETNGSYPNHGLSVAYESNLNETNELVNSAANHQTKINLSQGTAATNLPGGYWNANHIPDFWFISSNGNANGGKVTFTNQGKYFGTQYGLTLFDGAYETIGSTTRSSLGCYINSEYNTGWMHGDIKGAFLSDTTVESLTANTNLATNATQYGNDRLTSETYDDGDTSWQMVDNTGNPNGYVMIQLNGLTVGQSYIISVTFDNNNTLDAGYEHRIDHNSGNSGSTNFTHWNKTNASSETLTGVFTAQTVNSEYFILYVKTITVNVSNFIVRAVDDEDRSVNNKGLQVFGTVTKSAVATGAELVAYSGWSTSNYLEQPYNSDLNFGADDFSIQCWIYNNASGDYQCILDRCVNGGNNRIYFGLDNAEKIYFYTAATNSSYLTGNTTVPVGTWSHICVNRRSSGTIEMYLNGILDKSQNLSVRDVTNTSATTKIGDNNVTSPSDPLLSPIALLRISASAPSPEQIKKIYEDEKVLFQENAACTLYGSSDAVTALAYDEVTERLHVGTSSGRSEFQGLRRINNTTTAVTTAISAYDSFVVEQ